MHIRNGIHFSLWNSEDLKATFKPCSNDAAADIFCPITLFAERLRRERARAGFRTQHLSFGSAAVAETAPDRISSRLLLMTTLHSIDF